MKRGNVLKWFIQITANAMKYRNGEFMPQSKKKAESKVPPIRVWGSQRLGTAYRDGNGWYRATPMK